MNNMYDNPIPPETKDFIVEGELVIKFKGTLCVEDDEDIYELVESGDVNYDDFEIAEILWLNYKEVK